MSRKEGSALDVQSRRRNYKTILFVWPFVQVILLVGTLYVSTNFQHLNIIEVLGLALVQGMITGAVGITFAHELMHQRSKLEVFLSDVLMAMSLYGHFRTEHVHVHHRFVGTKKDAVTARYDEGFYFFFMRVIPSCFVSAWRVEADRLKTRKKSVLHITAIVVPPER